MYAIQFWQMLNAYCVARASAGACSSRWWMETRGPVRFTSLFRQEARQPEWLHDSVRVRVPAATTANTMPAITLRRVPRPAAPTPIFRLIFGAKIKGLRYRAIPPTLHPNLFSIVRHGNECILPSQPTIYSRHTLVVRIYSYSLNFRSGARSVSKYKVKWIWSRSWIWMRRAWRLHGHCALGVRRTFGCCGGNEKRRATVALRCGAAE